jgi:hypothetical protein
MPDKRYQAEDQVFKTNYLNNQRAFLTEMTFLHKNEVLSAQYQNSLVLWTFRLFTGIILKHVVQLTIHTSIPPDYISVLYVGTFDAVVMEWTVEDNAQ